mgnify:CR=1 FL=1
MVSIMIVVNGGCFLIVRLMDTNICKENVSYKNNCGLGLNQIAIRENGDVSPCVCFFYSMGNLKKNKLSQILTKDVGNTIKDLMSPNFYLCHECTNGNSCTQCIANVYELSLIHI